MRTWFAVSFLSLAVVGCSSAQADRSTTPGQAVATVVAGPGVATPQNGTPLDAPNPNAPWVGAAVATDALVPGAQDTQLAVWIDIPRDNGGARSPAAIAVVIDTSGSMAGDKMVNARKAAGRFVDSLADGDIVSLHTFSDEVAERVSPVRLDASSRARFASAISELTPAGGTNLFDGVRVAGLAVMNAPASHAVRRVVLVSDGIATVGTTSRDMLGVLGDRAGDRGVQITGIGVGLDYDEQALNALAIRSSGRLYHLENAAQLADIMTKEKDLLQATRITNAFVDVVPAPGVQLTASQSIRTNWNGTALRVPLGALFAGQHKEFVLRARVTMPQEGSQPIASVRLVFQDPRENNLERVQEAIARVEIVRDSAVAMSRKNEKAQGIIALAAASEVTDRAISQVNADDFDGADRELKKAEDQLRAQASMAHSAADKSRFDESANRVSQARASTQRAKAAPAPAKAAAKRAMSLDANDSAMEMRGF